MRTGRLLAAVVLAVGGAAAVLRAGFVAVRVEGVSMEPTLRTGDRVLVRRTRRVRRGQVVVLARPGDPPYLIKRAVAVPGDPVPRLPALSAVPETHVPRGSFVVLGDNPAASFDSRQAGYFAAETLLGIVVRRMR